MELFLNNATPNFFSVLFGAPEVQAAGAVYFLLLVASASTPKILLEYSQIIIVTGMASASYFIAQ